MVGVHDEIQWNKYSRICHVKVSEQDPEEAVGGLRPAGHCG